MIENLVVFVALMAYVALVNIIVLFDLFPKLNKRRKNQQKVGE